MAFANVTRATSAIPAFDFCLNLAKLTIQQSFLQETKARKVEQPAVAPQLQEDAAVEATVSEDTVADTETVRQEKE